MGCDPQDLPPSQGMGVPPISTGIFAPRAMEALGVGGAWVPHLAMTFSGVFR